MIILVTTSCQASLDNEGWFNTWSAEWQARQLLLIASDPGPAGKNPSPGGTSSFSDFNVVMVSAWSGCGNRARARTAATGRTARSIPGSSSGRDHMGRFNGVVHVAGRIPDLELGLRLVLGVGAANHQGARAARRQRKLRLPLPKAVCSLIDTKLRRLPALAAIDRQIDAGNAAIAAEGDAARRSRRPRRHAVAVTDVGDERPRRIAGHRHHLESGLARLDGIVRRIGHAIASRRPVIGVGLIQHFDIVQHLDPVNPAPAGHDESQRKSVQQWKLLAVHGESDHRLAVASGIDGERLQEFRRVLHHRLVQATEADLNGTRLYTSTVKHVLETHTGPDRVAHRTICPLRAGNAWFGIDPRSAGALVDRGARSE